MNLKDGDETVEVQHWLTATSIGWRCTHPSCDWYAYDLADQTIAQQLFDGEHAEMSGRNGEPV